LKNTELTVLECFCFHNNSTTTRASWSKRRRSLCDLSLV